MPVLELVDAVNAAGLKPLGIELEPFALVRALGEPAQENEAARLYVHIGASNAILAIAIGHTCMFTRSAPVSGPGLVEHIRMLLGYHASQPGAREVAEVVVSGAGPTARSRSTRSACRTGSPSASPPRSGSSRSPPAARRTSVT